MAQMANVTTDPQWNDRASVKTLMLEHHMAARRMGFDRIFDPLYAAEDPLLHV
jgi:DNA helicase II / ATP-dependent DNA helicase PcrA